MSLVSSAVIVASDRQLADDPALETGLFFYLSVVAVLYKIKLVQLALREGPVVISGPMHEQNLRPARTVTAVNHQPSRRQVHCSHRFKINHNETKGEVMNAKIRNGALTPQDAGARLFFR